jgi:hypothetical protein
LHVHADSTHQGQVHDETAFADSETAGIVPSPPNGRQQVVFACRTDRGYHIGDVNAPRNGAGTFVDHSVIDFPRAVVSLIRRQEDGTAKLWF